MNLPNDISRCGGETLGGATCEKRDTCLRYLEPVTSTWAWHIHPQIPGPCGYYLPRREAPGEGLPRTGSNPLPRNI